MELTGTIKKIYPTQSGSSKAGKEWKKRDFVVETQEQYPKTICFTVFTHVDILDGLGEGQTVNVNFSIESREYNGKWYHNINAFGVHPEKNENANHGSTNKPIAESEIEDDGNDLPF